MSVALLGRLFLGGDGIVGKERNPFGGDGIAEAPRKGRNLICNRAG